MELALELAAVQALELAAVQALELAAVQALELAAVQRVPRLGSDRAKTYVSTTNGCVRYHTTWLDYHMIGKTFQN